MLAALLLAGASQAQMADFDTSRLPQPPTTFEEQRLWDEVLSARSQPTLAPQAHLKLADYYERKGLTALAARERSAAGVGTAPTPAGDPPASAPRPASATQSAPPTTDASAQPAGANGNDAALDPQVFDLSAFPAAATNFEEQLIYDSLRDPGTLTSPALLAFAHRQLGRYYAGAGRADLAAGEYARAVLAAPEDPRGYAGLAALSEAVGAEPSDGTFGLREVSEQLQTQDVGQDVAAEPEPEVAQPQDPAAWQEVSAEFNRRMNYLYTSNAWSNVSRTVFTNLYGR